MNDEDLDWTAVTRRAEQILNHKFNRVERFSDDGRLNLMLRCSLENATGTGPKSVVIKQMLPFHDDPDKIQEHDMPRIWRDWAGAELLTAVAPRLPLSPLFYGGDAGLNFIILEDLGTGTSLVEPLLEGDYQSARVALLTMMRQLGQMHTATWGKQVQFVNLLNNINNEAAQFAEDKRLKMLDLKKVTHNMAEICPITPGFLEEARQIIRSVTKQGRLTTFIHGDPCPDNLFFQDGQMRLIDFERSHFGHALRDALYPRMNFPTCWCANRIPASIVAECESVYRAELAAVFPFIQDDVYFGQQRLIVCASWLLDTLSWMLSPALNKEYGWGIASDRSRVVTQLTAFLSLAEDTDSLSAIRETAANLLNKLQKLWPDSNVLPLYPAFQNGEK